MYRLATLSVIVALVFGVSHPLSAAETTPSVNVAVEYFQTTDFWDRDGDGLSDYMESFVYHTDPDSPDTDGDGMADGFELRYFLNPIDPEDAGEDPDNDGLSNLEEFIGHSDPRNVASPRMPYFVSSLMGSDTMGNGSYLPWRTIGHALASTAEEDKVAIFLLPGLYEEDVTLTPGVSVSAFTLLDTTVRGVITGAEGASLRGIRLEEPTGLSQATPLLHIDSVTMTLRDMTFAGATPSVAIGIVTEGDQQDAVFIERCAFTGLHNAIEVFDAIPTIRACWFGNLSGNGILFRAVPQAAAKDFPFSFMMSTADNPNTGYNTFILESICGKAIVNERADTLIAENNDWNTDDSNEIAEELEGDVDYEPFLAKSSGLLAGSICCSVWNAKTQGSVLDATVQLTPSPYAPVTDNVDGVYTFAAVPAGAYMLSLAAPGYDSYTQAVQVESGALLSLMYALNPEVIEGEGEGEEAREGEDEGDSDGVAPTGCFGGAIDGGPTLPTGSWGDVGLYMLVIVALLACVPLRSRWLQTLFKLS